jgi:hypothetical protein
MSRNVLWVAEFGWDKKGKRKSRKAGAAVSHRCWCAVIRCVGMCYCGRGSRKSDSGWDKKGKRKSRKAGAAVQL